MKLGDKEVKGTYEGLFDVNRDGCFDSMERALKMDFEIRRMEELNENADDR